MSRRALIGWVLAAAILAALVVHERQSRPKHAPAPTPGQTTAKTYQQLAAANYRTLTRKQSARLFRFATAFRSCMAGRGIELTAPAAEVTKIVLRVAAKPIPQTIPEATVACGDRLGGPPPGSALQTPSWQSGVLVLYLPKRCLLDPDVTTG
jgi:hypothetical protein